ncbi:3926_t:CDS:2 [Ambispora gerdemannii]|uniref:3926_t:CDS:1 n=1 Tax=Ambispora gerdemannii TaxID=144530 RepID=A0A9N9ARQ5_9GLOM|nr:3926_t:CDS:2 [Ambispora gerdemannii]
MSTLPTGQIPISGQFVGGAVLGVQPSAVTEPSVRDNDVEIDRNNRGRPIHYNPSSSGTSRSNTGSSSSPDEPIIIARSPRIPVFRPSTVNDDFVLIDKNM